MDAPESYHVFICHASEDKADLVGPLADALKGAGLKIWYDEFSLQLGDSLRRSIDRGLNSSRFGIVVLSKAFFAKNWPQYELDGLVQREMGGRKVILPIWHGVTHDEVAKYSSSLADRVAAKSDQPMAEIVRSIAQVVYGDGAAPSSPGAPVPERQRDPERAALFDEELKSFWSTPRPVSFEQIPYWYVRMHSGPYASERIATLSDCYKLLEQIRVQFRGWDFPHVDRDSTQRSQGNNWISSWNTYFGQVECWRLYQSGQFVHLMSVREFTEAEWRTKLGETARAQLGRVSDVELDSVPGYLDIVNCVYEVSEVYELAARMCRQDIYQGNVHVGIELRGIKGFALMADTRRLWRDYCAAGENTIGRSWEHPSDILVREAQEQALHAVVWLFERFGWLDAQIGVLRETQAGLTRRSSR